MDPIPQDHRLPLFYAAARGHTTAVRSLLAAAPDSAGSRDRFDAVALHCACSRFGNAETVEMLVGAFPDWVSSADLSGKKLPLHSAVLEGASPDTISALLRANRAAAMAPDVEGRLPLHYVGKHTLAESARLVLEAAPEAAERPANGGRRPLHCAAVRLASADLIRLLHAVYPGAASIPADSGFLPLHIAVRFGAPLESVRALLELNPAAAAHTDEKGRLPLHLVNTKTPAGVAELLLAAHPEAAAAPATGGRLPLHFCVANSASAEAVAAVAAANPAAAYASDEGGNLAAHLIQANATAELVAAVLGANPEAAATRNDAGQLPLHAAIAAAAAGDEGTEEGLLALARAYPAAALERGDDGRLRTSALPRALGGQRLTLRALRPSGNASATSVAEETQREIAVTLLHPLMCHDPGFALKVKSKVRKPVWQCELLAH